jgi:hypothetical protein
MRPRLCSKLCETRDTSRAQLRWLGAGVIAGLVLSESARPFYKFMGRTPPLRRLDQKLIDLARVLDRDQSREALDALDRLYLETGIGMYVVLVHDFRGMDGAEWVTQTANNCDLRASDILFAAAVKERKYGISYPAGGLRLVKLLRSKDNEFGEIV